MSRSSCICGICPPSVVSGLKQKSSHGDSIRLSSGANRDSIERALPYYRVCFTQSGRAQFPVVADVTRHGRWKLHRVMPNRPRIRQTGTQLFWIVDGTSKGSYVNLAIGAISGNTITGKWVDMPASPTLGGGDISLRIESNNRLMKVSSSTNYGAQAWTRLGTTSEGGNQPGRPGQNTLPCVSTTVLRSSIGRTRQRLRVPG